LARIVVDVAHLLTQELGRKDVFGIVAILPHSVSLLAWLLHGRSEKVQDGLIDLGTVMADQSICGVFLEIAYDIPKGVIGAALDDNVDVVGHHDESVQLEPSAQAHTVQAVHDQAFHRVALEEMVVLNSVGGDKVQVVRIEVWSPV
jgi:hypothetical protein